MVYYKNLRELIWISRAGIEKGYLPVYESNLVDYKDRSAMGTFSYEPFYVETLSKQNAYYVYR